MTTQGLKIGSEKTSGAVTAKSNVGAQDTKTTTGSIASTLQTTKGDVSTGGAGKYDKGSASSTPSSSPSLETLSALLSSPTSDMDKEIVSLRNRRDEMKRERKRVVNELRNTERNITRMCARARLLSANDLLEVYAMRIRNQQSKEEKSS